jgi:hypothetical protein
MWFILRRLNFEDKKGKGISDKLIEVRELKYLIG